jgi:hypothetical protein
VAFTYDVTLATTLSQIRFMIGDTVSSTFSLTDAEVNYCYAQRPSVKGASIMCLRAILAKFKTDTDRSANGFSSSRSQRFTQVKDLLATLEDGTDANPTPTFTGASAAVVEDIESDTDYIRPEFSPDDNENDTSDNTEDDLDG